MRSRRRRNSASSYETRTNVVKAEDMPWERSPDGLIKHLVHQQLNTRECCVESYMQFLKAGRTIRQAPPHVGGDHLRGRRRGLRPALGHEVRLSRSVQMGMGRSARRASSGSAATSSTSRRSPRISISPSEEARLIMMSNRIVKEMGFDWFDLVERAPGFRALRGRASTRTGSREARTLETIRTLATYFRRRE